MTIDLNMFANLNMTILFTIGTGIILVIIGILYTIDYQLRKKRVLAESTIEYRYSVRYNQLKSSKLDIETLISQADRLGRDFISEKFGSNMKLDYSQLMEQFKDKGKPYVVAFCQTMLEILYSGEKPSISEARTVMSSIEMMLRQEGALIITKNKDSEVPTEKTNFITDLSKKIELFIEKRKESKGIKETKEPKKKEENSKEENRKIIVSGPIEKREMIIPVDHDYSKAKVKDYRHIESIDSLDRIKNKIKKHKENRKIN